MCGEAFSPGLPRSEKGRRIRGTWINIRALLSLQWRHHGCKCSLRKRRVFTRLRRMCMYSAGKKEKIPGLLKNSLWQECSAIVASECVLAAADKKSHEDALAEGERRRQERFTPCVWIICKFMPTGNYSTWWDEVERTFWTFIGCLPASSCNFLPSPQYYMHSLSCVAGCLRIRNAEGG